ITSLLSVALAMEGYSVCLVDLDLTAPGLASVFQEYPDKGILDYLLIDADTGRRGARVSDVLRELHAPIPDARGRLSGILGRPELNNARAVQAYLLAEVRTGMLSSCLEHLLHEAQQQAHSMSSRFDLFVLDTPPSLFGLSAGARRLVEKHGGAQVFVAGPTVQDLAWVPEMVLSLREHDVTAGSASAIPAFVLNAYPYELPDQRSADLIAEQILRCRGDEYLSGGNRAQARAWSKALSGFRPRVIGWSEAIRTITLDPRQADEAVWGEALSQGVNSLAGKLADDVLGRGSA
ncbi:MAG: CpsD/CapB family tyrosine-protein kinase, partial [Anaerolineales bacterium]|nr:CpsD/CapB family tyrosine-protein kinase [Anaerolineales bacterium]